MKGTSSPLISVMMLTYNHAQYISQAIESVLSQNCPYGFELIICDDASKDGTQDIARRYAEQDSRVVLSLQPRNTQFGKNFVDGCALIRGKYVAFCEGDDYWTDPQKLQKQVSFLEAHPDFAVCAHKVQILEMSDNQPDAAPKYVYKDCSGDEERIRDGIFYADEAIANYYFQTGSLVLRWRFPEGLPHWFRKRMMFDHFMFMLHAVQGKIKYFDEHMSVWRRNGEGYTWLQTQDKGLFFQKEGYDWICMYANMDKFFSRRFTFQIRERILLALRSIAQNCLQTGNVDQLRLLIKQYEYYFSLVLKDAVLLDALRIAYPERRELSPPWESTLPEPAEQTAGQAEENPAPASAESPTGGADSAAVMLGGFPALAITDVPVCQNSVWNKWVGDREYARFANLRSALMRWLWQQGVAVIWLPTYAPPMLGGNLYDCQFSTRLYSVGNTLEPSADFLSEVRPGEAVLTINYLGRPLPAEFRAALAARKDILWIEDRAHCMDADAETSEAHAVIYSPRKLFGVPDGGLLVGQGARELESWRQPLSRDLLTARCELLLERLEQPETNCTQQDLRAAKLEMEHQLSRQRMSRLTEAILRRIPYDEIAARRKRNWEELYRRLGALCLWPMPRPEFTPLGFPLLAPSGYPLEILHTQLTKKQVFCHRAWYPLDLPRRLFPLEEALSQRLLLLPCDQRYDPDDMARIASLVEESFRETGVAGRNFSVLN